MSKVIISIPNKRNFCGGNFQDWLEVMLIDKCNGTCSWCVDKNGYHPKEHAEWSMLARKIISCNRKHIILLGGEPTLYKKLRELIVSVCAVTSDKKKIYLTTNGSMLTPSYVAITLYKLTGINISIHHYDLAKNKKITGISLEMENLRSVVKELHKNNTTVRLNCNLIKGDIDSKKEILLYLEFAKDLGIDSIRFAELKDDKDGFVDLTKIFKNKYGINNDPFNLGCNSDCIMNGMPVNFRQMCGLQTEARPKPINPKQFEKIVLYYNAVSYKGWQSKNGGGSMDSKVLKQLLKKVADGRMTAKEAQEKIEKAQRKAVEAENGGCYY